VEAEAGPVGQPGHPLRAQRRREDLQQSPTVTRPKQMARSSARNLMKTICSQRHRLRDRRSWSLNHRLSGWLPLGGPRSASVV
jgi:hypothetical protein